MERKYIKAWLTFVCLAVSSSYTYAQQRCSGVACTYLDAEAGVALSKGDEEKSQAYRAGGGVYLTPNVAMGVSGVHISPSLNGAEAYLRGQAFVGDKARLYLDIGGNTLGDNLTLGTGLFYNLAPRLALAIGYRAYMEVSPAQGDVYSLMAGLQYQFQDDPRTVTVTSPSIQPRPAEAELPPVTPTVEQASTASNTELPPLPHCRSVWDSSAPILANPERYSFSYHVVKGDWPLKIAREHCTTLEVLRSLNAWLDKRVEHQDYIYPGEHLIIPTLP